MFADDIVKKKHHLRSNAGNKKFHVYIVYDTFRLYTPLSMYIHMKICPTRPLWRMGGVLKTTKKISMIIELCNKTAVNYYLLSSLMIASRGDVSE